MIGTLIEGTLHQVEFNGKEIVRSAYPYGIMLMGRAYHAWLYDGDPLEGLNFPRAIENIRKKWAANPELFQETVREWFLDNPHRLLSVMEPSTTYQAEQDEAFKKKMALLKASLSVDKLESIREDADALKKFQAGPDAPEAASALPRLSISDISRSIETIPTTKAAIEDVPVMMHDIFANGIAYLDLAFDVSDVPEDLQLVSPPPGEVDCQHGGSGPRLRRNGKTYCIEDGGNRLSLIRRYDRGRQEELAKADLSGQGPSEEYLRRSRHNLRYSHNGGYVK